MKKLILILASVSAMLFFKNSIGFESASNMSSHATVQVNYDQISNKVLPELFGTNLQWVEKGDRFDSKKDTPSSINSAINDLGVTSIRFPGGALANTYKWKQAIGRSGIRKKGLNYAFQPESSDFGADEFTQMCDALNVEAVVTINPKDSEQNAADWVEYMNGNNQSYWGKIRHKNNGSSSCYVKYWEIGNEVYSPNDPAFMEAKEYAKLVKEYSAAMKKRDPNIKVGIVLEGSFIQAAWLGSVLPHMVSWNKEVLQEFKDEIDFVSVHFYAPFDTLWDDKSLNKMVWSSPIVFAENLKIISELIKKHSSDKVKIGVTEYGTFFGEKISPSKRIESTENALFMAMSLFTMIRDSNVVIANNWSLMNNSRFGMLKTEDKQIILRPNADVFRELSSFKNGHLADVVIDSPGYSVSAKGNIPNLTNVSFIDALAVKLPNGTLGIALVNRSPDKSVLVRIEIKGNYPFMNKNVSLSQYNPYDSMTSLQWVKTSLVKEMENDFISLELKPGSFTMVKTSE